jgi:copper homeostasis protein (lipoprotein)
VHPLTARRSPITSGRSGGLPSRLTPALLSTLAIALAAAGATPLAPLAPLATRAETVRGLARIPEASAPVTLQLVPVGSGQPPATAVPLGRLPASWRGELAGAGSPSRWQVDLLPDGGFQLRQTVPGRPVPHVVDDLGRWRLEPGGPQLEPGSQRLVLRGSREAPLVFQPLEGGAALRQLDPQGGPIRSRQPDRLRRLATFEPIDPRLHLQGLFVYLADAASLRLCATGARLPVAMEGDYRRLEEAYRKARPAGAAGQPLLVHLEGLITDRPSAEPGQPPRRTVVVERFVGTHPDQGCPAAEGT